MTKQTDTKVEELTTEALETTQELWVEYDKWEKQTEGMHIPF